MSKKSSDEKAKVLNITCKVSKIYKYTQNKNARLQRGANDKNINHVLLK
jgi:hypothetical protein